MAAQAEAERLVAELEEEVQQQEPQLTFWQQKEAELRKEEDALASALAVPSEAPPLTLERAEPEPEPQQAAGVSSPALSDTSPGASSSPSTRGLRFGVALAAQEEDASPETATGGFRDRRRRAQSSHEHQQRVLQNLGLSAAGQTVHAVPHRRLQPEQLRALAGVWEAHGYARAPDGKMVDVDETIMLHIDANGGVSGEGSEASAPAIDQSFAVVRAPPPRRPASALGRRGTPCSRL